MTGEPVYIPLASTACEHGRVIADHISGILAYAPPFATALDVLIYAATTLENMRLGVSKGDYCSGSIETPISRRKTMFS